MKFTVREIVETVRNKMNAADEKKLYEAAERLEFRIAEINNKKPPEEVRAVLLLYKGSNYLLSLMAACVAISKREKFI